MTREELVSIAKGFGDSHTVSRFKSCLKGFGDCTEFLNATEGNLMKAYAEARPNSGKGLGKKFWALMTKVRIAVKERAILAKKELEEKQRVEAAALKAKEAEQKAREAEFFTYKQLRAITAFMELGGVEKIDLRSFRAFCESVHVAPDLTKEKPPQVKVFGTGVTDVAGAGVIGRNGAAA